MHDETPLDLAIVGGGLAGLIHLHYARLAGLRALVLERESDVGGLWRRLPAWQDLQVSPTDFVVGSFALEGPMQPQVLAYVQSWVERYALAEDIRVDTPVHRARHTGSWWELDTPVGTVRAQHLVAATGGHNRPMIPAVLRRDSAVQEFHSSALRQPETLKDRYALVVGGGASAFDLIDLCLSQGARRIAWVYRDVRWFSPTRKAKAIAGTVRPFARLQAESMSAAVQSATIEADLASRYAKFGIQAHPAVPIARCAPRSAHPRPRRHARQLPGARAISGHHRRIHRGQRGQARRRSPPCARHRLVGYRLRNSTSPISRTGASLQFATSANWARGAPANSEAWMRRTSTFQASASTASAPCHGVTRWRRARSCRTSVGRHAWTWSRTHV